MTHQETIEPALRRALAAQAARIPAGAAERLGSRDYRPRTHATTSVAAAGGAAVAVAAGSVYLAGLAGQHGTVSVHRAAAQTIRLDGYTVTLPASLSKTGRSCAMPQPPGLTGAVTARPTAFAAGAAARGVAARRAAFAAGAAAHGGCVGLFVTFQPVTPPAAATPVRVGHDQGFLATASAGRNLTLYVRLRTSRSAPWLVISATGLSQAQVMNMAGRAVSG